MKINDAIEDCRACVLANRVEYKVHGRGNFNARVMIVAEAPGSTEYFGRYPLIGRSGQLLNRYLCQAGVLAEPNNRRERHELLYITNTVKCWPYEYLDESQRIDSPMPDSRYRTRNVSMSDKFDVVQLCSDMHLNREVRLVRPRLVVALGRVAASLLLHRAGICPDMNRMRMNQYRGNCYTNVMIYNHQCDLLVTYHPAYLLRNNQSVVNENYKHDLRVICDYLTETR